MTRKLLILTLAAIGLACLARLIRVYLDHQMIELDKAMLRAQVPFGPLADHVDRVNHATFLDHDNIAPVYGYQFDQVDVSVPGNPDLHIDGYRKFSHTPRPGSAEAFRAAFNPGENTGPAAEARRRMQVRWDEEMGR